MSLLTFTISNGASNTTLSDLPFLSSYFHSRALVHTIKFSQSRSCNRLLIRSPPCTEQLDFTDFSKTKVRLHIPSSLSSLVTSRTYRYKIQVLQVHLPVISLLLYFFTKARPYRVPCHSPNFIHTALPLCLLSSCSFALSPSSPSSAF